MSEITARGYVCLQGPLDEWRLGSGQSSGSTPTARKADPPSAASSKCPRLESYKDVHQPLRHWVQLEHAAAFDRLVADFISNN